MPALHVGHEAMISGLSVLTPADAGKRTTADGVFDCRLDLPYADAPGWDEGIRHELEG